MPSCGETCTIQDALCSRGYSHLRNIAKGQPPFIISSPERCRALENSLPAKTAAAPNWPWQQQTTAATVAAFKTRSGRSSSVPALACKSTIYWQLISCIVLPLKGNTGVASWSHSLHGARPQDDTDTRSWLKSATARCTEDTQGYLGPAVQKTSLPPPLPLCHHSHHSLFFPFLLSHFTLFTAQESRGKECFWGTSKWRLPALIWYPFEFRYVQKLWRNVSIHMWWLHATLQWNSLPLMAN